MEQASAFVEALTYHARNLGVLVVASLSALQLFAPKHSQNVALSAGFKVLVVLLAVLLFGILHNVFFLLIHFIGTALFLLLMQFEIINESIFAVTYYLIPLGSVLAALSVLTIQKKFVNSRLQAPPPNSIEEQTP